MMTPVDQESTLNSAQRFLLNELQLRMGPVSPATHHNLALQRFDKRSLERDIEAFLPVTARLSNGDLDISNGHIDIW